MAVQLNTRRQVHASGLNVSGEVDGGQRKGTNQLSVGRAKAACLDVREPTSNDAVDTDYFAEDDPAEERRHMRMCKMLHQQPVSIPRLVHVCAL